MLGSSSVDLYNGTWFLLFGGLVGTLEKSPLVLYAETASLHYLSPLQYKIPLSGLPL